MIRFIDLRHVSEAIQARFAFWNTVTDKFFTNGFGDQAWDTMDQFTREFNGTKQQLERLVGLSPAWTKEPAKGDAKTAVELVQKALEIHIKLDDSIYKDAMGTRLFLNQLKSVLVELHDDVNQGQ